MNEDDIRLEESDGEPVVAIVGVADHESAERLDRAIAVHEAEHSVIVSFLQCVSVDAEILAVIARWNDRLRGNLVLVVPTISPLRAYFEDASSEDSLRIVGDLTDAVTLANGLRRIAEPVPSRDGHGSGFQA